MNTTLPYNNNLNDENSKPKQKQTKKALINLQTIPSKTKKEKKTLRILAKAYLNKKISILRKSWI